MNMYKMLTVGLLSFYSFTLFSLDCSVDLLDQKTKKYSVEAIRDLSNSAGRLQGSHTQEELIEMIVMSGKEDFVDFILDLTGGHQSAVHACIAKARLTIALLSYGKTKEERDAIAKKHQDKAQVCVDAYYAYRDSLFAYNLGDTEFGRKQLDLLANRYFKA